MKMISFRTYLDTKGNEDVLIDLITVPLHMRIDYERRNENVKKGNPLCRRCDGTGNELFSMWRCCSECKGTGVKI